MNIPPVLLKDGYKVGHIFQYPSDTTMVYSNFTPRKGRDENCEGIIFFGLQYFIEEYLVRQFNENFFNRDALEVVKEYKRRIDNYLGPGVSVDHIADLHELGFLPLEIKALPEGSFVPYGVPVLTIKNTIDEFFWLTNMLESLMSNVLWMGSTSATTAFRYRQVFESYAHLTIGDDLSFVPWQGHDFSFRGMPGVEAACISGAAHLTSFTGTDTIPAIDFLEQYYGADCEAELIGGSVPATEHSVMSMGGKEDEIETFARLMDTYPNGILSVVSDTWDFWKVVTEYLPTLKDAVMARDGKLVIRPDSGDPVKIICGDRSAKSGSPEFKGAIECLWDIFGGITTNEGYKLLDSHIGLIYGDSITLERQERILSGLRSKGFASYNVVLGIGSYTYQYVTRDTHCFAMKATAGMTESQGLVEIFKDPVTDDGTKKSARGLLRVDKEDGRYVLRDRVTPLEEKRGCLKLVFRDSDLYNTQTLSDIRERVTENANA